jgi:hypothetical protein
LIGKLEGKRPLGRPRREWKKYIKMEVKLGGRVMDWINLTSERYVWRAFLKMRMILRVA